MQEDSKPTEFVHKVIAVEEHFMHTTLTEHFGGGGHQSEKIQSRLYDYAEIRIEEMNAAGINMQILSHQSPGSQRLANDIAADELQRSVEELGLKGAMIHGLSQGEMVDSKKYWPIFARAEKLGVPIYLHPADPDKQVSERYYSPYDKSHPMLTRAAWGFGLEAGTQAVRLILSGVFDKHPNLKILLGHFGEAIPFWMPRIHESSSRSGGKKVDFAGIFRENFWITTSGFFSDTALRCCLEAIGPDRILFAVDWPYADNTKGVDWLKNFPLEDDVKAGIFSGNAETLLEL